MYAAHAKRCDQHSAVNNSVCITCRPGKKEGSLLPMSKQKTLDRKQKSLLLTPESPPAKKVKFNVKQPVNPVAEASVSAFQAVLHHSRNMQQQGGSHVAAKTQPPGKADLLLLLAAFCCCLLSAAADLFSVARVYTLLDLDTSANKCCNAAMSSLQGGAQCFVHQYT